MDSLLLKDSELFDAAWYRASAGLARGDDPAEHYLLEGWQKGLEPGPDFDGSFLSPYFRTVGYNGPPAIAYLCLQAAGWLVYPTRAAAERLASLIRPSDLFDATGYARRAGCPDDLDPALHYVIVGEQVGIAPSDRFDSAYYHERYPDVRRADFSGLVHYLTWGRGEGRRPISEAANFAVDASRLDPRRETVLLVCNQATRTGAPILAYNIATRLQGRYNVVVLLLSGGDLARDFAACSAAVVGPLTYTDWHLADAHRVVRRLLASLPIRFAIANSLDMGAFVSALASALVPVVTLVNEFPLSIRPRGVMGEVLDSSTQVVFSTRLTADAAILEHPTLAHRTFHVLPQGRCDPPAPRDTAPAARRDALPEKFRPAGLENALVVLGCGTVFMRKGVDVFLSCAAAVKGLTPRRPVRFVWIGHGYDPGNDTVYSAYLAEHIMRAQLDDTVTMLPEIADLDTAYDLADVFFISSRLDPMPNVGIDAAMRGLPVVCFQGATGMADILGADADAGRCVVPYLDVHAAALVIARLAEDEHLRRTIGDANRRVARTVFDFDEYVRQLDRIGQDAVVLMEQRARDLRTLVEDPWFDEHVFVPPDAPMSSRESAIRHFLNRWAVVGTSRAPAVNFYFRRPFPGFHPQIYAHEHADTLGPGVNPLADYIRRGAPAGPWRHEVLRADTASEAPGQTTLRTAIHAHFYYPELMDDFLRKLAANRSRCDLLLSTDEASKAAVLRDLTTRYDRGEVTIRVVPNRGRDIGPFLTAYADEIERRYDVVGHLHGKQSLFSGDTLMGDAWREFLWQNLVGDLYPMMDIILARFAGDDSLGLVFPDDPHLPDWDCNLELGSRLAQRMGMTLLLPPFFDFPVGTMFWARPRALAPMFRLKLEWADYPEEPLAIDGTLLHALERLLPFAATHAGFRWVTTHVPEVTW